MARTTEVVYTCDICGRKTTGTLRFSIEIQNEEEQHVDPLHEYHDVCQYCANGIVAKILELKGEIDA